MQSQQEELAQRAIQAALQNDWETATKLNQEILSAEKDNVETLNRLARAFFESGNLPKATTTYKKVLRLDPYNPIASKNLGRLSTLEGSTLKQNKLPKNNLSLDLFLEEPGKTKIIQVVDLTSNKALATLRVGDELKLSSYHNDVKVSSPERKTLGKLEEDLGAKIANALRSGSKFSAIAKSIQIKESVKDCLLSLFVKETFHSPKLPVPFFSISTTNHFTPYVKEQALTLLTHENESSHDEENLEETDSHSGKDSSLETLAEREINQNEKDEEDN